MYAEVRSTGGVALYVRNDINYEIVLSKKVEMNVWCVAIVAKDKLYVKEC